MRFKVLIATLATALALPGISFAAPLYVNNFETDTTASWTVNKGPLLPAPVDEAHNFFFDYSTVGIPKAPHSALADGTRGMKLQANQSSGVFGGMSASPTGQSFTTPVYRVQFDWWGNFNGPFPVGGSGSTQLSTFGVQTAGTSAQWPGGVIDGIWFGGTGDGNSAQDWRAYSPASGHLTPASGVYAAGTGTSPDARNHLHPYYASFGANAAPAAQLTLYPQQTGVTLVGSPGMEWHKVVIERKAGNVKWTVDNVLIATVPLTQDTVAVGNNIFFGHSDTNATSSTDVNDVNLLFTLIDNVEVVPEPGSFVLCLLGFLGFGLGRRRR